MNVVITGGAGFIGSHLVEHLLSMGSDVTVIDDYRRGKPHINPRLIPGATYLGMSCTDPARKVELEDTMAGADIVFNLAASVAGVIYNVSHQTAMFNDNMMTQMMPVLTAASAGVSNFVQISSVCVYSPANNHPAVEHMGNVGEPHEANNGYGWSKRMGEKVAKWQQSAFGKIVVVRPSNVFGPRDWFDHKAHVIPALIKKIDNATDSIVLHGSGNEIREFIYVTDIARGMAHAIFHGRSGEVYNVGNPSNVTSIKNLALSIMQIMGKELDIVTTPEAESGDPLRWSDISKMKALDWHPAVSLHDGLVKTVEYYLDTKLREE